MRPKSLCLVSFCSLQSQFPITNLAILGEEYQEVWQGRWASREDMVFLPGASSFLTSTCLTLLCASFFHVLFTHHSLKNICWALFMYGMVVDTGDVAVRKIGKNTCCSSGKQKNSAFLSPAPAPAPPPASLLLFIYYIGVAGENLF